MPRQELVHEKISQLVAELKRQRLWKRVEPLWAKSYAGDGLKEIDFLEWLQFVYLPNCVMYNNHRSVNPESFIMLEVKKHLQQHQLNDKIIQLLVEIDSM